jgi:hypothetical protein
MANDEATQIRSERGLAADASDPARLEAVVRVAIDYRGDVTLTVGDEEPFVGFLFDLDEHEGACRLRVLPGDGGPRRTIALADVRRIELSGRDTAAGKSFDTWVKKYIKQKLAGAPADIEAPAPGSDTPA